MPVVTIENNDITADRALYDMPVTRRVDTAQVVTGGLREGNTIAKIAQGIDARFFHDFEEDHEFDPYEDMHGYEAYADKLEHARNREEMTFMKGRIDKEVKQASDFADATTFQKFLTVGALIATDPTTLIPMGGAAYKTYRTGGRILEGGIKTAAIAAATESGREALLQMNSYTRTGEESLYSIGSASLLGFVLGGAAGGLSKAEFSELATRLDDDLVTPANNRLSSVGAMQVGTTMEQEEIKGLARTKKVFDKLPGFLRNPVWEGATSESKFVRDLTEKLSDLSLVKNKNTEFIASNASVELRIKGYDTLRVPYYKEAKAAWKDYRTRMKQELSSGLVTKDEVLNYREFREAAGMAARRNDTSNIPEVTRVAKSWRKNIGDPVLKRAEEAGVFDDIDAIDVKTADSWLKRMYDHDKIINRRTEFKEIVLNYLKREQQKAIDSIPDLEKKIAENADDAADAKKLLKRMQFKESQLDPELDEIAEQIIDRITNATHGRLPYDNKLTPQNRGPQKVGARGSAKARVFNIPDEEIEDFLISDLDAITDSYLRTMAPDNELMATFGTLDFDVLKKQIQEDYQGLRAAAKGDNKRLAEIDKMMGQDIKNMQGLWEKLRGIYKAPDDYAAPLHRFERGAMALNYARLLGDVVASSLPDMGRHVMVHGFDRTYGKLMKSVIQDIKGLKMAAAEAEEIGLALDMTNSITALTRANMDEYTPIVGKVEAGIHKVSKAAGVLQGINVWNSAQKVFAGIMTQNRMLDGILALSKGKQIGTKEIENLASHGIDQGMAKRIAAEFGAHGETRKVLKIANARIWTDSEARNAFRLAVRKQADEIIVTPGLDRPLWMSKPGWRMVGQFKSYSFASMNRVALAGLQQADVNVMQGLTLSVFLGSLVYGWKTMLAGKTPSDDPRVWISEGIDRAGVTGWFFDVNNIVEKVTRGRIGVNALVGGPPMSRYASRNLVGALLGPTYGLATDMGLAVGAISQGDIKQSDVHAMRRILPFQNIPYLKGMFNQLETGVNGALGIEE